MNYRTIFATLFLTCALTCAEFVYAETIDPAFDIANYEFRFTRLTQQSGMGAQGTVGSPITLRWDVPTETMDYDEQPDPSRYGPYDAEVLVKVSRLDIEAAQDGGVTYNVTNEQLTEGQWQVQIRCSRIVSGLEYWSKFSNAVPFELKDYTKPPQAPFSITIPFK